MISNFNILAFCGALRSAVRRKATRSVRISTKTEKVINMGHSIQLLGMIAVVTSAASISHAGLITTGGATPTPGGFDQSQLSSGTVGGLDNNTFKLEPTRPYLGQTFRVPDAVGLGGAYLNSFSLNLANYNGSNRTFEARILSLAGGSPAVGSLATIVSTLAIDTGTVNGSGAAGWLTFTFDALQRPTLTAGQTYGFALRTTSTFGWGDLNSNIDSSYANGRGFSIDVGATSAFGRNLDRVFVANLVVIPEPTTLGLIGLSTLGLLARRTRRRA